MSNELNLEFHGNWKNNQYYLLSNNTIAEIGYDNDIDFDDEDCEYDPDTTYYRFRTYDRDGDLIDDYGGYTDLNDMKNAMWGKPIEDLGVTSCIDEILEDDFTKNALEKFDRVLKVKEANQER